MSTEALRCLGINCSKHNPSRGRLCRDIILRNCKKPLLSAMRSLSSMASILDSWVSRQTRGAPDFLHSHTHFQSAPGPHHFNAPAAPRAGLADKCSRLLSTSCGAGCNEPYRSTCLLARPPTSAARQGIRIPHRGLCWRIRIYALKRSASQPELQQLRQVFD